MAGFGAALRYEQPMAAAEGTCFGYSNIC